MDHHPKSPFRRRTSSLVDTESSTSVNHGQQSVQLHSIDDLELAPTKYTRFRRSSFALAGERSTTMDNLVDSALHQATSAAATREAATISAIVSPSTQSVESLEGYDPPNSQTASSHTYSVSTVVAVPCTSPSQLSHELTFSGTSADESVKQRGSPFLGDHPKDADLVWYNSDTFSSNPFASEVVMKYLAALAVEDEPVNPVQAPVSTNKPVKIVGENIPGLLPLTTSPVASMTMPVQQVRRAHNEASLPTRPSFGLSSSYEQRGLPYSLNKFVKSNDCSCSSGFSDTEPWYGWHRQGYSSDNPVVDVSLESKRVRMFKQRFDSEFPPSTTSLSIRSPKKGQFKSRGHETDVEGTVLPGSSRSSPRSSTFDLSHVYDDLPVMPVRGSKMSSSSSSLNFDSHLPCFTPPSTPSSLSNKSSTNHSMAGIHGMQRLRSLLDHLTPRLPNEDTEKYIYLDEETRAKRVNAQASNVISPVSF